jgi:hypothetical protein
LNKTYVTKKKVCAIMDSPVPHKGAADAVQFCKIKNLPYELIPPCHFHEFLEKLAQYDTFVFFPHTPETLSRMVVEARMLGTAVITNGNVGAVYEPWFEKYKGEELISLMKQKRLDIVQSVVNAFKKESCCK